MNKVYVDLEGEHSNDYGLCNLSNEITFNEFLEEYFESLKGIKPEELNKIILDSYVSVNAKKEEKLYE